MRGDEENRAPCGPGAEVMLKQATEPSHVSAEIGSPLKASHGAIPAFSNPRFRRL